MNRNHQLALSTTIALTVLGVATSAMAAGDTTVSFTVTGGSLSVALDSGADGASSLGSSAFSLSGNSFEADLDAIVLTDETNVAGSWCLSAALSDTNGTDGPGFESATSEVDGGNADMWLVTAVPTGTMTAVIGATALAPITMDLGGDLVGGVTVLGGGTVTITPRMKVTPPAATPNDTYSATVTYTAVSAAC